MSYLLIPFLIKSFLNSISVKRKGADTYPKLGRDHRSTGTRIGSSGYAGVVLGQNS